MRKLKTIVALGLVSFNSFAMEGYFFENRTKAIYWIDSSERSAILYRNLEGFDNLLKFISQGVQADNLVKKSTCDNSRVDKLMIYGETKNYIISFYQNCLVFEGKEYLISGEKLNELREVNQFRIAKGDSVSSKHLAMAKERLIKEY